MGSAVKGRGQGWAVKGSKKRTKSKHLGEYPPLQRSKALHSEWYADIKEMGRVGSGDEWSKTKLVIVPPPIVAQMKAFCADS